MAKKDGYHYSNMKYEVGDVISPYDNMPGLHPSLHTVEDLIRSAHPDGTRIRSEAVYLWMSRDGLGNNGQLQGGWGRLRNTSTQSITRTLIYSTRATSITIRMLANLRMLARGPPQPHPIGLVSCIRRSRPVSS